MSNSFIHCLRPVPPALALAAILTLLGGCSSNLASFDDVYVPESVEENFPITVVEAPIKLVLDTAQGGLKPGDTDEVVRFARQAASRRLTPVTVAYSAGSATARAAAHQAAGILVGQGVERQAVVITPNDGKSNRITLVFSAKVAETKPCGDWSQNMRANQFNDSGPNFGCAVQQNYAAMIANPEDLQHHRAGQAAQSASQAAAFTKYYNGEWTKPTELPDTTATTQ